MLIFLLVVTLSRGVLEWDHISSGIKASNVAAGSTHDSLWAITNEYFPIDNGFSIAKYDFALKQWVTDDSQPVGAASDWRRNYLAVDHQGNPAFRDLSGKIHWKKDGRWKELKGCGFGLAFLGRRTLMKRHCNGFVYKY